MDFPGSAILAQETRNDPFPVHHALRDDSPVQVGPTTWALLRHDDVKAALVDTERFASSQPGNPNPMLREVPLIFDDEPRHGQLRSLVNRAFTPRRVAELEPAIRSRCVELLEAAERAADASDGVIDFVRAVAAPLPVIVIATMLGIDASDAHQLKRWSEDRARIINLPPDAAETSEVLEAREGSEALKTWLGRLVAERRASAEPPDDLMTALVQAEVDGRRLDDGDVRGVCALLLDAGNLTTTRLITNATHVLARRPDVFRAARADRSLAAQIVEETLRWESPVQFLWRRAVVDIDVRGTVIPAGSMVLMGYGPANRDPSEHPDPDAFRLGRPEGHLAFGFGIHHCLGANLARLEGITMLDVLLDRYEDLEPAAPARRDVDGYTHSSWATLPLRLHRKP